MSEPGAGRVLPCGHHYSCASYTEDGSCSPCAHPVPSEGRVQSCDRRCPSAPHTHAAEEAFTEGRVSSPEEMRRQALADAAWCLGSARRTWEDEPDSNPEKAKNLYAYAEAERVLTAWAEDPSRMDGHLFTRAARHWWYAERPICGHPDHDKPDFPCVRTRDHDDLCTGCDPLYEPDNAEIKREYRAHLARQNPTHEAVLTRLAGWQGIGTNSDGEVDDRLTRERRDV